MKKDLFNQRQFKYGALATVITIVFIAVVVLINVVVSMLEDRLPLKIDLTSDKKFAISDQTKDLLKTIDTDIDVIILMDEASLASSGIDGKQVSEIINKYTQYSDKIKVQYLNPDKNPEKISEYNELYKGDISSKFALIKSGDKIKALTSSDFVNYEQTSQTSYSILSTAEQAMTTAIMNVIDKNPKKVTVLNGENAMAVTTLVETLEKNGYELENVDALTGEIDPESSLVIINSPLADYNDEQITKLEKYLDNDSKLGKNILYIASYLQKETPNLDSLLAEYGLEIQTGFIFDEDTNNMVNIGSQRYGVYASVDNETYSAGIQNTNLPIVVPYSRPINLLFESKDQRTTESILKTMSTSFVYPNDADENTDVSSLEHSEQNVMAIGSKYIFDDDYNKITSNIFAIGSVEVFSSTLTSSSYLNNAEYVLNVINKLTGKESTISIVAKDLTSTSLNITQAQSSTISTIVMFIVPALIIIAGIVVWVRRRNR